MSTEGWPGGRWKWGAGIGVGVLVFLTSLDLVQHYRVPLGAVLALGLARGLVLALAWLRPRGAVAGSLLVGGLTAAVTVPIPAGEPWPWGVTAVFGHSIVLAIAGARGLGRYELLAWWGVTQLVGAVAVFVAPERGSLPGLLTMAAFAAIGVGVAELLRSRADTRRRLVEQQEISRVERTERARLEERARIARELHDVVAHHLSVVVVRADSAPHRLGELPENARQELAEIAGEARASLAEMRRVLKLLRAAEEPEALGPQPGLMDLAELVASTRRAGVDIHLAPEVPSGLDPAIELTAYRVAQEALSNAVRHAPEAVVQVCVRPAGDGLRLTVRNGPGLRGSAAPGSGHGIIGMRERVALVDGTLTAEPTPDGGFVVDAVLPGNVRAEGAV